MASLFRERPTKRNSIAQPRVFSEGEVLKEEEGESASEEFEDAEKLEDAEELEDADTTLQLLSSGLPTGQLVGKGLCGIVHETAWRGRKCARKDFVDAPRKTFKGEVRRLSRLRQHENVVTTYRYSFGSRSCSLLLELMDDDLLSFILKEKDRKEKASKRDSSATSRRITCKEFTTVAEFSDPSACPLELPVALDIMLQIATGMKYLHEMGVPHGDLNPRNVLIRYSHQGQLVKVSDYGMIQSKSASMYLISHRTRMFDMAQWKAPEYLGLCKLDDEDEDMASDIDYDRHSKLLLEADVYSFGMTSFQILTGEIPFPYRSWKDLVKRKTSPEGLWPTLPAGTFGDGLVRLLESCWAVQGRPTFAAIREDLEAIMNPPDWAQFPPQHDPEITSKYTAQPVSPPGEINLSTDPRTIQIEPIPRAQPDWADWSYFDSFPPQHDPEIISKDEVTVSEPMSTAQPVSPLGDINQNIDPRTIQIETDVSSKVEKGSLNPNVDEIMPDRMENKGADVEDFSVPAFAVDISKRKRIRRRLIIVFCPGHDEHRSPPETTEFPAFNSPIDAYRDGNLHRVEPGEGGSEFNFAIPEEATTAYYEHKGKRPLAVVSVRFCKSKTRAVKRFLVDSTHAMLFEDYLGPDHFPPYGDPGESQYVSPESSKYGRRLGKPFRLIRPVVCLIPVTVSSLAASSVEFCTHRSKPDLSPLDFPPPD